MKKGELNLNSAIGDFFKSMRKQQGLSGKELAILLKLSQQQISRYETGKTEFTINKIIQFLDVFGLSFLELIHWLKRHNF